MYRPGITSRITILIILVAVISAGLTGFLTLNISKNQFGEYIDRATVVQGNKWVQLVADYYDSNGSLENLQTYLFGASRRGGGGYRHGAGTGNGMFSSGRSVLVSDSNGLIIADSEGSLLGQEISGISDAYTLFPVSRMDGTPLASVYVFNPLQSGVSSLENDFVDNISRQVSKSMSIVALAALLLGVLLARRVTGPVARLSRAIHQLARGDFSVRVEPEGDREFITLAGDFNRMAEKLHAQEQSRNALVANIAHELRTPLSIVRGQLESLQSGSLVMTEEIATGLVDEMIRLTRLVKDLEIVGLAESGALQLNIQSYQVQEIIERLLPLRLSMEEQGIVFTVQVQPGLEVIRADINRLLQVLINLLTNAMRHVGSPGKIDLRIMQQDDQLVIAVEDNGQGIPEKEQDHIFERFYRLDESRTREGGGTGLGLAIAKSYVQAHRGSIRVESKPGTGSTFIFQLPQ